MCIVDTSVYQCRDLATNIGISYTTPEEFFLNKDPQPFVRTLDHLLYLQAPEAMGDQSTGPDLSVFKVSNKQDIVLFCGSPGAGKSTFYWEILKPLGYERVNQDILKSVSESHALCCSVLTDCCSAKDV